MTSLDLLLGSDTVNGTFNFHLLNNPARAVVRVWNDVTYDIGFNHSSTYPNVVSGSSDVTFFAAT